MYASMDFIVMENVAQKLNKINPKVSFDLKGSHFRRKINIKSPFWNSNLNYSGVLKDRNFTEICKVVGTKLFDVKESDCEQILSILKADSEFL